MEAKTRTCKSCGRSIKIETDFKKLFANGPEECPHCKQIFKVGDFLSAYWKEHQDRIWDNPIHKKNFHKDKNQNLKIPNITSYTLEKYKSQYSFDNRTETIENTIKRIQYVREYLLTNVGAHFEILESMFNKDHLFWNEFGNAWFFIQRSSIQYIVINLTDILCGNKDSKYSITKIRNILLNNQTSFYKKQKVYEVMQFEQSKDVIKEDFAAFPILQYFKLIDETLDYYKDTIRSIKDMRDNEFAHIGHAKNSSSKDNVTLYSLKQMYYLCRLIYDGFSLSLAPDKTNEMLMDYNMWFSHMNDMAKYWIKNVRDPAKQKKNHN